MRFELTVSGGVAHFPGLARPTLVDTAALPAAEAAELERLAAEANVLELTMPAPATRPDARRYKLKVEAGSRSHELTLADPIADAALAGLIRSLQKIAKSRR